MAALERRNDSYRVVFMYGGRKHAYSVGTADRVTAEALRGGAEKTLLLLRQGLTRLPPGGDVVEFVRSGGVVCEPSPPTTAAITFGQLREAYLAAHGNGAVEQNTLATARLHFRHLAKTLGDRFAVGQLKQSDLQRHIDRRLGERFRGRPIGPLTVRKEVASFRAMWNWGVSGERLPGVFPSRGLRYPKTEAKPPFKTLAEIERRVAIGGLTAAEQVALYESLYLRREEIDELLEHVRRAASYPWVYPLVCTAAHTGARRSELLRMEVADLDMARGLLLVREKKRSKRELTTRHVSVTPFLAGVLRTWIAVHPGGRYLFCQTGTIGRSRTRGATTGHAWGRTRPTTTSGRTASVQQRPPVGVSAVTKNEAHDHLKRTLAGSRWGVIRGFHVLRHSFISCLAAAGVDQRIIDEFVGHSTDEQRRRYRHLIPDVKQRAIESAFGRLPQAERE